MIAISATDRIADLIPRDPLDYQGVLSSSMAQKSRRGVVKGRYDAVWGGLSVIQQGVRLDMAGFVVIDERKRMVHGRPLKAAH
jgi:RecG-like helicase